MIETVLFLHPLRAMISWAEHKLKGASRGLDMWQIFKETYCRLSSSNVGSHLDTKAKAEVSAYRPERPESASEKIPMPCWAVVSSGISIYLSCELWAVVIVHLHSMFSDVEYPHRSSITPYFSAIF